MRGLFLRAASSEPEKSSERLTFVLAVAALVLAPPLLGFMTYFWILGARASRARHFPPEGRQVVCDTPVCVERQRCFAGAY